MSIKFVALDGEMTAASIAMGGRIFQIGIVLLEKTDQGIGISDSYTATFNPGEEYYWDPEAEAVHGCLESEILEAQPAADVDSKLAEWLRVRGVDGWDNPGIAVGFNVGAFDLPHIEVMLPETFKLFSRRSVDLNAICFTLDDAEYNGQKTSWAVWKRMAKKYAERSILLGQNNVYLSEAHDALYDSYLHYYAWSFLQAATHGSPLQIPGIPSRESDVRRALKELTNRYTQPQISELTGVPIYYVKSWLNGGRATRKDYIESILKLVKS